MDKEDCPGKRSKDIGRTMGKESSQRIESALMK
jgi:hypothetical protein